VHLKAGELFKRFDKNMDGVLERGESDEVANLLDRFDLKDDKLTFQDFKVGVRSGRKKEKQKQRQNQKNHILGTTHDPRTSIAIVYPHVQPICATLY
jgi:hypothetical protein